jgi:zeaxanthin glucosyltransferase
MANFMKRVIFLFYHGQGHVIAFSKIAKILQAANSEVYFAGSGYFRPLVSHLGFKFYLLKTVPFGMGLETWVNAINKKRRVYFSALRDRITDKVFSDREVEIYWMLEELKPEIILLDALQATDFIVLYPYLASRGIKVGMINSMLPLQVLRRHPPLNSDIFSEDERMVEKAIRTMLWNSLKKSWKSKLIHLGFDDSLIVKRRIKKNGVPNRYISRIPNLLNFAVADVCEFILAPREFDFPGYEPQPKQFYVGFMTDETRNEVIEDDYRKTAKQILALKKNEALKFIYCSFGTIAPKQANIISAVVKKLISVAAHENHILLISLKAANELVTSFPTSKNIHIFSSVPQLEVLKHADLFIGHGGLNSIKEAIYAEVPMLLYPIHQEYDPRGNAARAVYHGLGLRGNAAAESIEHLRLNINELLSNPSYKKNIQKLKREDAQYTGEKFLERFNTITPIST